MISSYVNCFPSVVSYLALPINNKSTCKNMNGTVSINFSRTTGKIKKHYSFCRITGRNSVFPFKGDFVWFGY